MKLHLLSTKPLVKQLAARTVDAEQQAYYLIASLVVYALLYYSGLVASSSLPWSLPSLLEFAVIVTVSVFGVFQTYEASGGKSNPSFLVEFTCLFVPVTITTYFPIWALYWVLRTSFGPLLVFLSESHMQFAVNLSRMGTDFFGLLGFLATVSALVISFWRVTRLMREVHRLRHGG